MIKQTAKKSGFTLIELLIALAVLAAVTAGWEWWGGEITEQGCF